MDLFATFQNKKTQLFCSWMSHQKAFAIDAMSISWQNMFAFAFTPIQMIPRVLQHMKRYHCKIILIAPHWPRQFCFLSSKHVSGFSDKAATLGESAVTGKGKSISPRPEISEFDGMAVVDRHFSAKGFSEETRKLLALSWRKGTRKDYTAKFKQFSMWCTERKVDPFLASLNDCADFLTSLFQRGLKYRTINGYRSMLSSFLPPIDNCPIGQHSYIIRLLKGEFNERPPVKRLIPNWVCLSF